MEQWERDKFDQLQANGYLTALSGHVQKFCAPLWWWTQAAGEPPNVIHGGTACLVDTGKARLVITCQHVLAQYEEDLVVFPSLTCQIGSWPFDPLSATIAADRQADIATFTLGSKIPDENIFEARSWPPTPLLPGESIIVGGFPRLRRTIENENTLGSSFLNFLMRVEQASDNHLSQCLDSSSWHWPTRDSLDPRPDLGGISGGPVFRRLSDAVEDVELAAIVYEAQTGWELVRARQLGCITATGQVVI